MAETLRSETISLPSADESGLGLRVEFPWLGDRFGHSILVVNQNSHFAAWEAGDLAPVFQQVHEQEDDRGRSVVLLMGASHRIHWSMSVHVPVAGSLCFDVAGRTKGNSNHVFVNGEQALHYLRASTAGELLEDSNVIAVPDNAATKVFQDDTRVAIWSKVPCAQAHPYTMRWRYRMTRRANE